MNFFLGGECGVLAERLMNVHQLLVFRATKQKKTFGEGLHPNFLIYKSASLQVETAIPRMKITKIPRFDRCNYTNISASRDPLHRNSVAGYGLTEVIATSNFSFVRELRC